MVGFRPRFLDAETVATRKEIPREIPFTDEPDTEVGLIWLVYAFLVENLFVSREGIVAACAAPVIAAVTVSTNPAGGSHGFACFRHAVSACSYISYISQKCSDGGFGGRRSGRFRTAGAGRAG